MALYGADISAYQAGFDFRAYSASHQWISIKQTEGLTWPNEDQPTADLLRQMREDAHAAGLSVILYHFLRPQNGRTGAQEAQHFIDFVGDLRPNEGVMIDDEWSNAVKGTAHEDFVISFLDTVEGRWPGIAGKVLYYSYAPYLAGVPTGRCVQRMPLWIAAYGNNDGGEHPESVRLDRWERAAIWQFTSNALLPGYSGRVDYNRMDVDLPTLLRGGSTAPATPVFVPEEWHGEYLRRGSSGIRVVQIQQRLARRGWTVTVDGNFGRQTDTIVRKFQLEKGLPVDGIIGKATWDALYAFFPGVDVLPETPPPVPPPPPPAPDPGEGPLHADPVGQCAAWGFDGNAGLDPVREFQRAFAWWPLVVDGDAGPKTAAAVQKVVDEGGKLSPHFAIPELACKHCGRIRFLRQTLECMELVRDEIGPFTPVSAYRCPAHNAAVGGATSSQHMMGAACDLNIPLDLAERVRFAGIGTCGARCLHGDRRDASGNNTTGASQDNPTYWAYC